MGISSFGSKEVFPLTLQKKILLQISMSCEEIVLITFISTVWTTKSVRFGSYFRKFLGFSFSLSSHNFSVLFSWCQQSVAWKKNNRKQKLCKRLKHCFDYEQNLAGKVERWAEKLNATMTLLVVHTVCVTMRFWGKLKNIW